MLFKVINFEVFCHYITMLTGNVICCMGLEVSVRISLYQYVSDVYTNGVTGDSIEATKKRVSGSNLYDESWCDYIPI